MSTLAVGTILGGRWQIAGAPRGTAVGLRYPARDSLGANYTLTTFAPTLAQNPAAVQALQRDAQASHSLPEFVVARTLDAQLDPALGVVYAVCPELDFPSLRERVVASGPLTPPLASAMLTGVAAAVTAAHRQGVVHRSLSPDSVHLNDAVSAVRVSEWGFSSARATVAPGWGGAAGYCGPDAANLIVPSSPAMDVFALGAILFFALTGRSPFVNAQSEPVDANALWAEIQAPIPSFAQRAAGFGAPFDASFDAVFARALAPSPEARFTTPNDLAQAFSTAVSALSPAGQRALGGTMILGEPSGAPRASSSVQPTRLGFAAPQPQELAAAIDALGPTQVGMPSPAAQGAAPATAAPPAVAAAPVAPINSTTEELALAGVPPKRSLMLPLVVLGALLVCGIGSAVGWSAYSSSKATAAAAAASASAAAAAASASAAAAAAAASAAAATETAAGTVSAAPTESAAPAASAAPGEAAKDALVTFECTPDCGTVTCGDKPVELSESAARFPAGTHRCSFIKEGYTSAKVNFTVKPGEDQKKTVKLTEKPTAPVSTGTKPVGTKPVGTKPVGTKPKCGNTFIPCK